MFIAGTHDTVAWFCDALTQEMQSFGLRLSPQKCVLTASAGVETQASPSRFQGWIWNTTRNIKVLGAAVGDEGFSKALVKKRRLKAKGILGKLGHLGHVQPALIILRSCASFAKLVHNCRTSPPDHILDELAEFDSDVKDSFVQFSQLFPDDCLASCSAFHKHWGDRPAKHSEACGGRLCSQLR